MKKKPKILFVCFADSPHSQDWIGIVGDNWDVRAYHIDIFGDLYPPINWNCFTYSVINSMAPRLSSHARYLFSLPQSPKILRSAVTRLAHRTNLAERWLGKIIKSWKPDIIHSLSLLPASRITNRVLSSIPKKNRPYWIVSSWGSDISISPFDEADCAVVTNILSECDGFVADCVSDLQRAYALNWSRNKPSLVAPVTGGIDVQNLPYPCLSSRNLVVVPKSYEGSANKILPIIESLKYVSDLLPNFEINFFMCSREARMMLKRMPEEIRRSCVCHGTVSKGVYLDYLKRARVMVAPSLSDGTPSSMLEAMAFGALPLMSPLDSIREWIESGKNGLLAEALYPDRIGSALRIALTDDALYSKAASLNQQIVAERANRYIIKKSVQSLYQSYLQIT